jgi:hypothetical protein
MTFDRPSQRCAGLIGIGLIPVLAGCGRLQLTVDDAIIAGDARTLRCTAYVERERFLGLNFDPPPTSIEFARGDRVLGRARTDPSGRTSIAAPNDPDGPARLTARATDAGRPLSASAAIFTWSRDRTIVVIDLDNTIVRTDFDKLVLKERDEYSAPLRGSRRVTENLAADFQIAYVTARPRFLLEKTRLWLEDEEYPAGPVIPSPGIRESIRRTEYKTRVLGEMRQTWPNLLIGIGNSESDREAYAACGLLTLLVNQKELTDADPRTIRVADWKALARFFAVNRELLADPQRLSALLEAGTIKQMLVAPSS